MPKLTDGQKRLYRGEYNLLEEEWQGDGTVFLTVAGGPGDRVTKMHVRDLWGPAEEVLSEEDVTPAPADHIVKRMEEAQQ